MALRSTLKVIRRALLLTCALLSLALACLWIRSADTMDYLRAALQWPAHSRMRGLPWVGWGELSIYSSTGKIVAVHRVSDPGEWDIRYFQASIEPAQPSNATTLRERLLGLEHDYTPATRYSGASRMAAISIWVLLVPLTIPLILSSLASRRKQRRLRSNLCLQ